MFNTIKELRRAGHKTRVTHFRYVELPIKEIICSHSDKENKQTFGGTMPDLKFALLMRQDEVRKHKLMQSVLAKGGLTRLEVTTADGVSITMEAVCCDVDNYDKKLGVKIALGRMKL